MESCRHCVIFNKISRGNVMKYLSAIVLGLFSSNLWAQDIPRGSIPEPEILLLIGIGVVALIASRSNRK